MFTISHTGRRLLSPCYCWINAEVYTLKDVDRLLLLDSDKLARSYQSIEPQMKKPPQSWGAATVLDFRALLGLEPDAGRVENKHDLHESFFVHGQYRLLHIRGTIRR